MESTAKSSHRNNRFWSRGSLVAATVAAAALLAPAEARAEGPVSGDGKGIVGGALLGGEVVTITMGAIGVEKGWPYFVFGGLGAVGGGVGGFFIEDNVSDAEVPVYMLAGGMALLIPSVVIALNATSYQSPEADEAPAEPAAPPGTVGGSVSVSQADEAAPPPAPPPHSAVAVADGSVAFTLPAPEVRPIYSKREIAQYGVEQRHELRFPVLSASF